MARDGLKLLVRTREEALETVQNLTAKLRITTRVEHEYHDG